MACVLDSQLPKRSIERGPNSSMYRRKRVYLPVLAIRVQGEAHLAWASRRAEGAYSRYYCTPRASTAEAVFSSHSTDDVTSPEEVRRLSLCQNTTKGQPGGFTSKPFESASRAAEIAAYSKRILRVTRTRTGFQDMSERSVPPRRPGFLMSGSLW